MTGPDHYREAERLASQADAWMDADTGWKAALASEERIARRAADLAAAQVHATLALAAATALGCHVRADARDSDGMTAAERRAWEQAAGSQGGIQ